MQLLDLIWGQSESNRFIVSKHGDRIIHKSFADTSAAYRHAVSESSQGRDVWFAVATFNSATRVQSGVETVKALFLDVDIKDKPGCYKTQTQAFEALRVLLEQTGLPAPTVVFSGFGLHLYWILQDALPRGEWDVLAAALRRACAANDFLADHSITTDSARILRVPGTFNHKEKGNPRPVRLDNAVWVHANAEIVERLKPFVVEKSVSDINAAFAVELPQTPKDALVIASKCGQMQAFKESKGNLPEPTWYAALGVLALCTDGEKYAHDWSSGHPSYRATETQAKFERAKEFAPTTCERFSSVNPDGCANCPFAGKIATPVQLGETVTEIEIKVERPTADDETAETELPCPKFYQVGKEGVFFVPVAPEGEAPKRQLVFSLPVWVSRVMTAENGAGSEVELVWLTHHNKQKRASFKQSLLAADQNFAAWLLDNNLNGFQQIKLVSAYIRAGIALISRQFEEETVYTRFGLSERGFVVGQHLITASGAKVARISEEIDRKKVESLRPRGSLEKWVEATKLLDQPNWWMHRFAVLAALGTPLFGLSGSEGSVLSLAGESSGGKTTAANFGASAYGDPKALTVDPQSTLNAFYEHWRIAGQLPVICNEAATIDSYRLKDVIYAAANGKARDRLTRTGRMKESGGWQTLTIFTSNTHLLALSDKILSEATRRRILELSFDVENLLPLEVGMRLNEIIKRNHGQAGRAFLEYVLGRREQVEFDIRNEVTKLQNDIDSVHRYNIWLIAVARVTAQYAKDLGIIEFDTDSAIEKAVSTLTVQAGSIVPTIRRVQEAIASYTNTFQQNIGHKASARGSAWLKTPYGEAKARYTVAPDESVTLCLPIQLFKEWSLERGIDINHVRQWARACEIKTQNVRLSEYGEALPCYVIPQINLEGVENASH